MEKTNNRIVLVIILQLFFNYGTAQYDSTYIHNFNLLNDLIIYQYHEDSMLYFKMLTNKYKKRDIRKDIELIKRVYKFLEGNLKYDKRELRKLGVYDNTDTLLVGDKQFDLYGGLLSIKIFCYNDTLYKVYLKNNIGNISSPYGGFQYDYSYVQRYIIPGIKNVVYTENERSIFLFDYCKKKE